MKKTWKELSEEGVQRCCAEFVKGGRCRRRAAEGRGFCAKHDEVMQRACQAANEAMKKC